MIKIRTKNFQPPSFLQRQKSKKPQPIYFIDVNIAPGKSGRITLYEYDNPQEISENFAKTFQLKEAGKNELCQLLEKQLILYKQQQLAANSISQSEQIIQTDHFQPNIQVQQFQSQFQQLQPNQTQN
eukprot:TRINITY_DN10421_c0_g1_i2.p1 TRINITY_DN10421_c0_g1~~TRINITY_DN10421_c0_g1_i2.p1  ORF type:complete len:127 (+),score=16.28 TRINITY_DN10421_c0_g1_i2:156-536(+)